jgi:hypothetical protein
MAKMNSENKGASRTKTFFKIGFSHLTATKEYLHVGDEEFDTSITLQSKHKRTFK